MTLKNKFDFLCLHVMIYIKIVTLHKYLSRDESLLYAHVTLGAALRLTLRKIIPGQHSYFGHMVLANNGGINLGLD